MGFLPGKAGERTELLNTLRHVPATLVFFESPHRLAETLAVLAQSLGARDAAVARELTKIHEEFRRGSLEDLTSFYAAAPARGEIVILVAPASEPSGQVDTAQIDSLLRQALPFMPVKAAATLVAEATATARREVYLRALTIMGEADGERS